VLLSDSKCISVSAGVWCASALLVSATSGVLQCVTVCCRVLQCVAVRCLSRQRAELLQNGVLQCVAGCCSVLQGVAGCCSVLQCVAVCCSVLQCVAVYGPPPEMSCIHESCLSTHKSCPTHLCHASHVPHTCSPVSSNRYVHVISYYLVNCKFKLNKNLNLNLYRKIPRNSNPIKISIRFCTVRYRDLDFD